MTTSIKLLSLFAVVVLSGVSINNAQAINPKVEDKIAEKKAQIEDKKTEKICNRIENVVNRLEGKINEDGNKLRERLETRTREMEENQTTRDNDLEERRLMRDESRNAFYADLETRAGDDEVKKTAVAKFKNSVEAAVRVRREAIDGAKDTMNKGIDTAIKNRESNMETLRADFKDDVTTAISKAKNSCTDESTSEDLKNVLTQLKSDVKAAQNTHKTRVNEAKRVQNSIQVLRETRKATVKAAIENFKAAMKTAQEELRSTMNV